jgi:hypothetical protein
VILEGDLADLVSVWDGVFFFFLFFCDLEMRIDALELVSFLYRMTTSKNTTDRDQIDA